MVGSGRRARQRRRLAGAVDDDKYLGPFTRTTSAPVLVIGNRADPATTYHGALVVDDLLPRSRLLTPGSSFASAVRMRPPAARP
jgi:hypothetical protein